MKALRSAIVPRRKAWSVCDDPLGEREHHGEHVRRHRLGVAAGLVDDEDAGLGAVLDVDGVEAGAVGGDDEQVGHAREQVALRRGSADRARRAPSRSGRRARPR